MVYLSCYFLGTQNGQKHWLIASDCQAKKKIFWISPLKIESKFSSNANYEAITTLVNIPLHVAFPFLTQSVRISLSSSVPKFHSNNFSVDLIFSLDQMFGRIFQSEYEQLSVLIIFWYDLYFSFLTSA